METDTDTPGLAQGNGGDATDRSGRELVDAAAEGAGLTQGEHDDLVSYFLSNQELPGDSGVVPLEVTLGHGATAKRFRCSVHPIEWSERQDAIERATDAKGNFNAFISSSWIVARALVTPKLGPTVLRLQQEDEDNAPADSADLLRRMFRKQSGALLELSGKVLELSKLQADNDSVREIEAAKN